MTRFEKPANFDIAHPHAAAPSVKTLVLLAALLAYAAGFVILYPVAASSVAKSAAEGDNPALTQFVGP